MFKIRTHTEDFKQNFKGSFDDNNCPICNLHTDSQEESIKNCEAIPPNERFTGEYEDIFRNEVPVETIKKLSAILKKRKMII